jgi:hypothetical protein
VFDVYRSNSDLDRVSPAPVETPIVYQEEDDEEDYPPPPPPPPLNESGLHLTPVNHRSIPTDSVIGQTVIEDHGIHGNVSILSLSRTDDSEEDPKKKNKVKHRSLYSSNQLVRIQ